MDGEEALPCEEDVAAIEVALLAAYQQDYNINPLIPAIRISSPAQPSIYHVLHNGALPTGRTAP